MPITSGKQTDLAIENFPIACCPLDVVVVLLTRSAVINATPWP